MHSSDILPYAQSNSIRLQFLLSLEFKIKLLQSHPLWLHQRLVDVEWIEFVNWKIFAKPLNYSVCGWFRKHRKIAINATNATNAGNANMQYDTQKNQAVFSNQNNSVNNFHWTRVIHCPKLIRNFTQIEKNIEIVVSYEQFSKSFYPLGIPQVF